MDDPQLSVCADAAFSQRLGSETEVEVIGGADKYVATCRECYAMFAKQAQESHATPVRVPAVHAPPHTSPPHQTVVKTSETAFAVEGETRRRLFSQDSLGSIEDCQ